MIYSRFVPLNAGERSVIDTVDHVRAHLSSVASEDDDPNTNADDVTIRYEYRDNGVMIIGELDAEPNAPYLQPGFDPDTDTEFRWEE
jgi:hypothetical protein